MKDRSLDETVHSLRRITTTGAVAAAVLLVGAVVLLALSVLTSLARFTPYGLWGILGVIGAALLVAALVWLRGPGVFQPLSRRKRTLPLDAVLRAPPPPPARAARAAAVPEAAGRLGVEASINRLVEQRRYEEALERLATIETQDPAMATFCTVKRRAIARRRALRR